jgi:hypothetical protein
MMGFADSGQAARCSVGVQQPLHNGPERWDQIRVRNRVHL